MTEDKGMQSKKLVALMCETNLHVLDRIKSLCSTRGTIGHRLARIKALSNAVEKCVVDVKSFIDSTQELEQLETLNRLSKIATVERMTR